MERKIIQIATSMAFEHEEFGGEALQETIALCNDGTVWSIHSASGKWILYPEIPQDNEEYEAYLNMEIKRLITKTRCEGLDEDENLKLIDLLKLQKNYRIFRK